MDSTDRPPGAGTEIALVALGGSVITIGFATWLGARLSVIFNDGTVSGGLDDWLKVAIRLARGQTHTAAWGPLATGLPSAAVYWTCTMIVVAGITAVVTVGVWWWRRQERNGRQRRFGQDTDARQARVRDLAPLVIDDIVPPDGRMLLGRMAGTKTILATEDRNRHPLTGRAARRQGNRGSVALIGPTGSGKTALAASAIATWDGPVVAVSVKRDLYDTTAAARHAKGEIAVFDPGAATGLDTARWSPLTSVTTSSGALRTGRALAQAIPRGGVTNADYWAKHGERLLSAFMAIAGLAQSLSDDEAGPQRPISMEQVASWVTTMAGANEPTINQLLRRGLDEQRPLETRLMARHAAVTLIGIAAEDHKIRSSIYSTAALALDPWLEPSVAHSATDVNRPTYSSTVEWDKRPRFIDLDWLMGGGPDRANTLYLAASQPEFERLSPVLGGLLADLKDCIHAWDIAGRRLDKPLLIVIDEAGQLELGWLPSEVSTIAALGAFFVTCWQSLSQMQHRYNTLADAVLSGHRTKCFFAGVDDLATTRYLSGLLGSEHVTRRGWSSDIPTLFSDGRSGRRSMSESQQREEFAPANALRQMYPGEAVLLHGTLPPAHLDAVRWWKEPQLAQLVPLDTVGNPQPPADVRTCPLTDIDTPTSKSSVDEGTFESTRGQLPKAAVARPESGEQPTARRRTRPQADVAQLTLDDYEPEPDVPVAHTSRSGRDPSVNSGAAPSRITERCTGCGRQVQASEAKRERRDRRLIVSCPECAAR